MKQILLAFLFLHAVSVKAQVYYKEIETAEPVWKVIAVNHYDHHVVIANMHDVDEVKTGAKISKFDLDGNELNSEVISIDDHEFMIMGAESYQDMIICNGLIRHVDSVDFDHYTFLMDENFNTTAVSRFSSEYDDPWYYSSILVNEDYIFIGGSYEKDLPPLVPIAFFMRYDHDLNLQIYKELTNESVFLWELEGFIGENMFRVSTGCLLDSGSEKLTLDFSLNPIDTVLIPNVFTYFLNTEILSDTTVLISGKYSRFQSDSSLSALQLVDNDMNVIKFHPIHDQKSDYIEPCYRSAISRIDQSSFYHCSNSNMIQAILYGQNTWLKITKLDTDLNEDWQYYYGGDRFYWSNFFLPTLDSCLLVAGVTEETPPYGVNGKAFLLKLDPDSLTTGITKRYFDNENITVYPNPGKDFFFIKSDLKLKELRLISIEGRVVLHHRINELYNVDVSVLPSGTYLYQIFGEEGLLECGKWMKSD
ncbi:MAG: T9SS type A sorting domain-containing protein [Bacteroidales bacterium]|nr:T9SS type A sorting domain-containing protein [Bacteroidales bacterium]